MALKAIEKLEIAYFEMLENMHYSKITVSEVIARAGVSRTTFYRHYVDVFDMHKKISEKLGTAITEKSIGEVIRAKDEDECFDNILEIFNSQEKYIVYIAGENGSRYFFEALYFNVSKILTPAFGNISEEQLFRLQFMTVSMIATYVKDLLEGREHNTRYIAICKKLLNFEELFGGHYAEK